MNILFICTGNTCRSPMAEALLKEKLPHIKVRSAGIYAFGNADANDCAIKALEEKDIQLTHQSQGVTEKLLYWADLVLTMTVAHKQLLNEKFPAYREKVFTLIEYATNNPERYTKQLDIHDPFGGDIALYRKTLEELDYYLEQILAKIN